MRRSIWKRIEEILQKHVLHGKWVRAVIALACVVIYITTYVLIMPAVTMARATDCGQEEHTHTEDCYETEIELTCGREEHTHTDDCYDEEGNLICGMEEHVHDDSCYTSREVLVCGQEEHVHTEDCYAEEEVIQEDIQEEAEEGFVSENEEEQPEAEDTDIEQVGTAAPEQLSQIRFKEYLTDWTTIYYVPEDGDNWQPLAEDKWHSLYEDNWGIRRNETEDRGLDPEEEVLLHIGYKIPAGQINATNPQTEFILPLSINMTEEEVRDNNNNNYTLFSGTDREENELFVDGEYEIVEEWNSDGEVTLRKLVITLNEDACLRCGGEKLTDGTETLAPQELEGFFELRVKAEDLLTLEKKSESTYVLEWNDEEELDTTVRFDPEKLAAYFDAKNAGDTEEDPKYASGTLTFEGNNYTVSAAFEDTAKIPEGAELSVTEIVEDDEIFDEIRDQVDNGLEERKETIPSSAILLDISIMYNDQVIEPAEGSNVSVEIKAKTDYLKGMYTDENSPVLINEEPVKEEHSEINKEIQVLHMVDSENVDIMETTDEITEQEVTTSFSTDSFSNWLVYLDEDLTDINLTTGDTLTLRPYTEWVWKSEDEPEAYQDGQWTFPSSDWNVSYQDETYQTGTSWNGQPIYETVHYTLYTHKTNGTVFRSFTKTDGELNETYTVVTVDPGNLRAGDFDIQTNKGKIIHVHVTQGESSPKPGTVSGIPGLTVNLFDYDVPTGSNGQLDFTHSGNLDEYDNMASSHYDQSVNKNHDFWFLGWGYSGDGYGVNSYTKDNPKQQIVKDTLGDDGYPIINNENSESLKYLFDPDSDSSDVYAFPNADGLFQRDNQGFYYYNSNVNYAEYDMESNQFILYEHTYSQNTGGSNGTNAKPFGFFPFHEYDTGNNAQPSMNHNKNLNHHFGMSMEYNFQIPKDRKADGDDGQQHDIIYKFSGDDDLWVFVDDELVLDIGGLHQPVSGSINFTTGVITVHGVDDITKEFSVGAHTLKMFYLERGGCDSNLSVRFNLPLVTGKAAVDIAKKSMTNDASEPDKFLEGAVFGIWETADCSGEPYSTAVSDENGHVDFGYLPVTNAGDKFYIKEIAPPAGYLLNTTVYTATAVSTGEDTFSFTITDGATEIEKMTQEPYYPIIRDDRPDPISLSVTKQWQNADGSEMVEVPSEDVVFKINRYKTPIKYNEATQVVLNVYRVGHNGNTWDWTSPIKLWERKVYAGNSTATINWTYNQSLHDSFKTGHYRVDNGPVQTKGNSGAQVQLPANGTVNVYIYDGNLGTDFEQFGVENITVSGTEGSGSGETEVGEKALDESFSQTLTLPQGGAWTGSVNNLIVQETKDDGYTYYYEYYITEDPAVDGFEVIYLNASGEPISDPSSQMTNHNGSQTVINRKLLDVPIEKHWADFIGDDFTWSATFQLQEMEVKVNDEDPDAEDANTESFIDVDGKVLTVSKGQTPQPVFDGLPMYRVHSNGTVYRILYSVEETAYVVKDGNNRTVAKWSKTGGLEVGSKYAPQFEQDAGENGSSVEDYEIFIVNSLETLVPERGIELDITKTWPGNDSITNDSDAFAKFVLKRLVHQEYRDYSDTDDNTEWVDITLDTWGNGKNLQVLHVPKDTTMHIVGSIKGRTNANKVVFSQSSGQQDIELIKDNTQTDDKFLFDISFTADQTKIIALTQGDNYVVGGRDGFFLSDTYGGHTTDEQDSDFAVEFTLNKDNNWHEYFDYLPTIEVSDVDPSKTTQTIYVYSYYLEELDSNPTGFAASFEDSQGNLLGNVNNGVDVSTQLTAENIEKNADIQIIKVDANGMTVPLAGALFELHQIDPDKSVIEYLNEEAVLPETTGEDHKTGDDGVATFRDLQSGIYEIKETELPKGYVLTGSGAFYVRISRGVATLVERNSEGTWIESTGNENLTYTAAAGSSPASVKVGNVAGTALPNAGGPGTTLFTSLGAMLIALAGVALVWMRKRRKAI